MMHLHWYRKTGREIAATHNGQFRERGGSPADIEYACRCGAKLYKRRHVTGYPLRLEAPLRSLEPAKATKEWTRSPQGGWWRILPGPDD